jgi:iron complex outermembrane receptor protein
MPTKNPVTRPFAVLLSCSSLLLAAQTAPAQTASTPADDTLTLPTFAVSTTQDKGYLAANAVSATRIATPIKDLPFAVSAFTNQFIDDIGARDLFDVARYAPGVTSAGREFNAGNSVYIIRGFSQAPQHDGFAENNAYVDTVAIDRVEVVKGPASLLYGQVAPGGTVNFITKRAEPTAFDTFNLQAGSDSFLRATADINQPLVGDKLLFRLNGAWENGFQNVTPSKSITQVIDPTVTWNLTKQLSLTVNYSWFHRRETPPAVLLPNIDIGTPTSIVNALDPTKGYSAPSAALSNSSKVQNTVSSAIDSSDPGFLSFYPLPRSFNYDSANDVRESTFQTLNAELDAKLGTHWIARANFDYASNSDSQKQTGIGNVYVAPVGALTYNSTTGKWSVAPAWTALTAAQQTAAYQSFAAQILADPSAALSAQPAILPRRQRLQETWGHSNAFQTDLAGEYVFNGIKLKPLFGAYYVTNYGYNRIRQNTGSAASPYFQAWDLAPGSPTYYMNQNTDFDIAALSSLNTYTFSRTVDSAAYGVLNASFLDDRLITVAGLRYNKSKSDSTNLITAVAAPTYNAHKTTPQAGVGYKLTRDVMLYSSYSQSYTLPGQSFLRTLGVANGSPAKPTTGEGYEFGVKTDLFSGRVSSTLSVYQIDQHDRVVTVNSINGSGATVSSDFQGTVDRSRGIEAEITWSPVDNWQVYASFADTDIRVIAVPAGYEYYLNTNPEATARLLGNLWTRYTFAAGPAKGFWVGGGFNYVGTSAQRLNNRDLYLPGYWLWNSAVGYDFTWHKTKFTAELNWNNMANVQYFPANQQRGLPDRAVLSLTAKF